MPRKILFFLESLTSGGKERRAVELLQYLKLNTDFDIQIVLTEAYIHYGYVKDLGYPIVILKRKLLKKDPSLIYRFFKIANKFKPDIIHSWGAMTTFYAIAASKFLGAPIMNSEIANATKRNFGYSFSDIIWRINKKFSTLILSNSKAGLKAYNVQGAKGVVIYNGVNLNRFKNLKNPELIKVHFNVTTKYSVIMVARCENHKEYGAFIQVAECLQRKRVDVTFIVVGDGANKNKLMESVKSKKISNFLFTGRISNVEELVNASDIGILLSNGKYHGEGIPNAVLEYMALGKPVIANDNGGTCELIKDNKSGFIINAKKTDKIVERIDELLDDSTLSKEMGEFGKNIIKNEFNIQRMGKEFELHYNRILSKV